MKLKVCGNRMPENIKSLMETSPDYLGFIFYPESKRYIGTDTNIRRFIASLSGIKKVGVFVNASIDDVKKTAKDYRLDIVQLHGAESQEYSATLAKTIPVIKAFGISSEFDFEKTQAYSNSCRYFLFDTACADFGGSGKTFDWSVLQNYKDETPYFLSGGIGPDHINAIRSLQHATLFGIDVNSQFESTPGIKNINRLKTFSNALRNR